MKPIMQAVSEIKFSISKIRVFEILLNSLIVFLGSYLVTSILLIPIVIPLSITTAYFIFETGRGIAKSKIREVEQHYPTLNEKLRTAVEYSKAENPVVNELHEEVISDLKGVEEAEFIDEKKTVAKSALAALLCFLILLLSPVTIKLDFIEPTLEKAMHATENITFEPGRQEATPGPGGGNKGAAILPSETDIYGTPAIAKLGSQELKLMLKTSGDAINIRQVKDVEQRDFTESYPKEVQAVSSATYDEKIPKEQQEIVKNYFTSIAQE